jgi:hypothetical protein
MSSNGFSFNLSIQVPDSEAPIHYRTRAVQKVEKRVEKAKEQANEKAKEQVNEQANEPVNEPVKEQVKEQCGRCSEDICWCITPTAPRELKKEMERKKREEREEKRRVARAKRETERLRTMMAKRHARIQRTLRMKMLRIEHKAQINELKANPMTWIERPYLFGRFETLLTVLRGRAAFSKITDEKVVALMPVYAVWLWTAEQDLEERDKDDNIVNLSRWKLMNYFADSLECHDK